MINTFLDSDSQASPNEISLLISTDNSSPFSLAPQNTLSDTTDTYSSMAPPVLKETTDTGSRLHVRKLADSFAQGTPAAERPLYHFVMIAQLGLKVESEAME